NPKAHASSLLSWLGHDINERRLAAHRDFDCSANCRSQILGIGNWPFAMYAHATRHGGVIDVRVLYPRPNARACDATLVTIGHALQMHDLLVICAIIVHHAQERDVMVCRCP